MDIIVSLTDEPSVTVTEVHPIALADTLRLAIDAAVELAQRLAAGDDATA